MTHRRPRSPRNRLLAAAALIVLLQAGCGPTYPKAVLDKAIVQLCREEYNVEVKVEITGNTVGVYIPIENLFDPTLNISKEAAKKINDVILSVSRVALSTDAEVNFYIVIAQDPILPEIEVVLIRYVRDLKMLHFDQISRGEFVKRMVIGIKLTPQAQKEKVLRSVFSRLATCERRRSTIQLPMMPPNVLVAPVTARRLGCVRPRDAGGATWWQGSSSE